MLRQCVADAEHDRETHQTTRHCERSEAIQESRDGCSSRDPWIASSLRSSQ
jgi:hypothetical protein